MHLMKRWSSSRIGRQLRLAGRMRLGRRLLSKHGGKAIFLSHTVGHMRSFIALSAGLTHMRYTRFLAFEAVAALVWNTAYSLLGYFIAVEFDRLRLLIERAGWIMVITFALFLLFWWWRKQIRSRSKRRKKALLIKAG